MARTILGKRKLGHAGEREEKDELFGFDLQGDSPVLKEVHSFDSFLSASEMPAKLGSFESEVRLICEEDRYTVPPSCEKNKERLLVLGDHSGSLRLGVILNHLGSCFIDLVIRRNLKE